MKKLCNRLKMILANQKGETIMEGIVSLLIFAVLMMTVTVMIQTSLHITEISLSDADIRQSAANQAVLGTYTSGAGVTLDLVLTDASSGISVSIPVNVSDGDHFTAFTPE